MATPRNHNLAALGSDHPSELAETETDSEIMGSDASLNEVDQLRVEKAELLRKATELEEVLTETVQKGQAREEQQKELEALLDEKSDVIRELHQKLQEQQGRPPAATPREEELLALHEELEEERRQLKEDEEALMQQMRQMEVQMARERAEVARQRSELQRLHNDIRHEIELASREVELRERLQPLQRRHQEMAHRKGAEPNRDAAPAPAVRQNGTPVEAQPARPNEGGILRRLFG